MRVLLGISGGIAAFKSIELLRLLKDAGHEVRCAPTRAALQFVTPLTLEILSGEAVLDQSYLESGSDGEELHITAAAWADTLCIVPATAHTIARLAHGLADDFLTTVALAADTPRMLAPAMHDVMWRQAAVQRNVERLRADGWSVLGPVEGRLASGELGWGRMMEPEDILAAVTAVSSSESPLHGRHVVVSAGPTWEAIDPVRFLGNRSSGKMGFALAREAVRRGARVTLIAGPVNLATPAGVERVDIESADELASALSAVAASADVIVMAAAVADYRPRERAVSKIKKTQGLDTLSLVENPDLLAGLATSAPQALRVGFAAETDGLDEQARKKLAAKDVDLLVANDVSRSDIGFGADHNEVVIYRRDGSRESIAKASKQRIAAAVLDAVAACLAEA